jgi:hypothetical protein
LSPSGIAFSLAVVNAQYERSHPAEMAARLSLGPRYGCDIHVDLEKYGDGDLSN